MKIPISPNSIIPEKYQPLSKVQVAKTNLFSPKKVSNCNLQFLEQFGTVGWRNTPKDDQLGILANEQGQQGT
jgi:hypothetical protein